MFFVFVYFFLFHFRCAFVLLCPTTVKSLLLFFVCVHQKTLQTNSDRCLFVFVCMCAFVSLHVFCSCLFLFVSFPLCVCFVVPPPLLCHCCCFLSGCIKKPGFLSVQSNNEEWSVFRLFFFREVIIFKSFFSKCLLIFFFFFFGVEQHLCIFMLRILPFFPSTQTIQL